MTKTVLWIDDSAEERAAGEAMLRRIGGIKSVIASSSGEATIALQENHVDAIVTDILRRNPDRSVAGDDGYRFFRDYVRREFPTLPVIFHTKNLPSTFAVDDYAEYLSKWDSPAKKAIELEIWLSDKVRLYDAYADLATWRRIEPRLIEVTSKLLDKLRAVDDVCC